MPAGNVDSVKADLYVNNDWVSNEINVRAGLWGVGYSATDAISSYPIAEFTNTPAFTGWRLWNSNAPGGWVNTTAAYNIDAWNSIELTISAIDDTRTDVYINGVFVGQSEHSPTAYIGEVILNSFNYATTPSKDYSVNWSNMEAGVYRANTAPSVVFNNPTPSDGAPINGLVNASVTAEDDYGMGSYFIRFWKDSFESGIANLLQSCFLAPGAFSLGTTETALCSYDVSSLPNGTNVVLSAQFLDGSSAWGVSQRTFTVDTVAPAAPVNELPVNGALLNTGVFLLDWNTVIDASGPVTYEYQSSQNGSLDSNGSLSVVAFNSGVLTDSQIQSTGTPDGVWYWQVRAIDRAGNVSPWSTPTSVNVDTVAPVVAIDTPTAVVVGSNLLITGTISGEFVGTPIVTINGPAVAVVTVNSVTGDWSAIIPTTGLTAGAFIITATVSDAFGNVSTLPATANVTLNPFIPALVTVVTGTPFTPQQTTTPIIATAPVVAVLGDTTADQAAAQEGEASVEGANTQNLAQAADINNTDGSLFGLAWYWWVLIVAALAGLLAWFIAALRRRRTEEQ